MTSARITKLLLLFAFATTPFCAAQQAQNQPLQLTIHPSSQKFVFHADLHNMSSQPLLLFVGWDPGGPRWSRPMMVQLLLTHGKDETWLKVHLGIWNIVGGEYQQVVYLRGGETFSFSLYLKEYLDKPLPPGRYNLQAIFTGKDHHLRLTDGSIHERSTAEGPDGKSVHLDDPKMPYWTGTVTSNTLPSTIPQGSVQ